MVIIVNHTLAERHWPGQDPIGKRLHWSGASIGVVSVDDNRGGSRRRQVKHRCSTDAPAMLSTIKPDEAFSRRIRFSRYVERRRRCDRAPQHGAARANGGLPPYGCPFHGPATCSRHSPIPGIHCGRRPGATAFQCGTGFQLCRHRGCTGVYGVLFSAASRKQEMAIRLALGSPPSSILRLILFSGARLDLAGAILGMTVAVFTTRLIRSQLFQVSPLAPSVLVVAVFSVLALAILASVIAARRAASIESMRTSGME